MSVPQGSALVATPAKCVVFVPLPPSAMSGYAELACVMLMPGVAEESTAETPVADA